MVSFTQLGAWVEDARQRTFELVADLSDTQLMGPQLGIVNPLLWEIGHVAWFQEKWVLRHAAKRAPILPQADALYDSAAIPHDTRWDLPLLRRDATLRYRTDVRDRVLERLQEPELGPDDIYFTLLSVFHEDMHTEAFTYTRQTLGYPPPRVNPLTVRAGSVSDGRPATLAQASSSYGKLRGDVAMPGGTFPVGAFPDKRSHGESLFAAGGAFVFDNEKWAHPVTLRPFAIARTAVTQAEFAAFVDEGGYRQSRFWTDTGWRWRQEAGAEHPVYWRREAPGRWLRRDFDHWVPLEADRPVLHVNWYEADAYCRWAGRRLPTEAEWEAAAAAEPDRSGHELGAGKRYFPWGDGSPTAQQAQLDWQGMGCTSVDDLPDGDSAFGCRQMVGNVWEWTADDFLPYPGFAVDPYKEYSQPWFGTHKVLRGGCWATRSRLIRNTWRNFYLPDRRDVWAGFRTCAVSP
jgi:gamma-glutamyl hercynylcysteine S-oxide synthase